ncbi:hypothetical protein BC477_18675 [Clavibacter michiganensis subsp. michiganensis]|uniref:Uncharacterized protein n=1 Tax=Clavibacter michiganensis subsp. michiganensis TaxID=33013 RepID=A0A251XG28_CLAMM|nr:hypothetical protein BC477_18675 [Clavibacter michiganensis subsp. michiganensis]OUE01509.1 hypothetical protein CMMCAS07_14460 [Clavibacter michiganensis subsp. michiganensis]
MNWPTLIMSPPSSTASTRKRRAKRFMRRVRVRSAMRRRPTRGRKSSYHHVTARFHAAKRRMRR